MVVDSSGGICFGFTVETLSTRLPAALSSGNIKADVLAISTSTDAADKLEASAETIEIGAAAAGTLSTTQMNLLSLYKLSIGYFFPYFPFIQHKFFQC